MKSVGDEQRIQALFCEFTAREVYSGPKFEMLWTAVEIAPRKQQRGLKGSLIVIMSAGAIAIVLSAALWKTSRPTETANSNLTASPETISTRVTTVANEPPKRLVIRSKHHRQKLHLSVLQGRKDLTVMEKSVALSRWQSPTDLLMDFTSGSAIWSSLPQLNESVHELKAFLPTNEVKESNQ